MAAFVSEEAKGIKFSQVKMWAIEKIKSPETKFVICIVFVDRAIYVNFELLG